MSPGKGVRFHLVYGGANASLIAAWHSLKRLLRGSGEHDAAVRAEICQGLQCFGLHLESQGNQRHLQNISGAQSQVQVRIVPSEEEIQIARHSYRLLTA